MGQTRWTGASRVTRRGRAWLGHGATIGLLPAGLGLAVALLGSAGARADDANSIGKIGEVYFSWQGTAGAGMFVVPNAQFGAGTVDTSTSSAQKTLNSRTTTPTWGEYFVKPQVSANYHGGSLGAFQATVNGIYAQTLGDGDANFATLTPGNPGSVLLEEAYVRWTGDLPAGNEGSTLVITGGRQNFLVDDGFLVQYGGFSFGSKAAYYLDPHLAFDGVGVVSFNGTPIRGDVFWLRNTTDRNAFRNQDFDFPQTEFAGFDLQLFENASGKGADGSVNYADRARYLSLTYIHVNGAESSGPASAFAAGLPAFDRKNLNVVSGGIGGAILPKLSPDATLYAQYVVERRGATRLDSGAIGPEINANAYFIEPGYSLSDNSWTPHLYYRYSHFSGPSNNQAAKKSDYDPLFYGAGTRMPYGTYFLGEIIGQYFQFNTNMNVHQVGFSVNPPVHLLNESDSLKLELIYYNFNFDKTFAANGLTRTSLANEVDIAAEYTLNPQFSVNLVAAAAAPGKGATQTINANGVIGGNFNKTTYLVEATLAYNF